ncbi:MAG: Holliday junction resolvase RuvX [Candidatus Eisenbacteria sp.]|nr:Holliday junction resolvase RuvX [Candidatus Eisenbacteria bacterium]
MGRRLGIDYGTKRIGLALSDELGLTARPYDTIAAVSWKQAVRRIGDVVAGEDVEEIVLGDPISLKGHQGTLTGEVHRFRQFLEDNLRVPVVLWDERLSSRAADRILREVGGGAKGTRDRVAAAWILQGYLDRRAGERDGA